ncbi:RNA polymerase sigma-54 factor [Evansella caseinilytica]|uniref:RNA polymerase sigma-54 factor n=1 Tax=Evansella caseinilytica TaxID=1503961 RepID=A0A1H3S9S1_9BACI|nr:RNA polymerase factor sigma-54 [Evansella caseinilytica]SDZ34843.1 RNA polymerase sigma-54 factor [Evansella caseinilytica]
MQMDFGLYQQQTLKLAMTNELRQAITILQYSVLDLNRYLQEQQLENPLIELKENLIKEEHFSTFDAVPFHENKKSPDSEKNYSSPIDFLSDQKQGLHDFLLNQIRLLRLDKSVRKLAMYCACSVDVNGYLTVDADEIASELSEPVSVVREAIQVLQSLEPSGVGASSLKDCLLLQLRQLEQRDLLAEAIVERHLDALAKKQYKAIAKTEAVDLVEVQQVADFIQTLNPKPGSLFHYEEASYVVPDVTVKKIAGDYHVFLNDEYMPKMNMSKQYEFLISTGESEVGDYMRRKYEQFLWIKKSIEQRQQTLLKVAQAIVDHQKAFFDHGPSALRPLTLKTIAEMTNVHESTVSRATTKKYIQTPRGLLELKYFFTSVVGKDSMKAGSAEQVKAYLKQLIDEENKRKPLSDQKLSELLKAQYHIHVSRRTVAKYREEMQILSSALRKRFS